MSIERRLRRNQIRAGIIQTRDAITILGRNFTQAAFMHASAEEAYERGVERADNDMEEAMTEATGDSFNRGYAEGYSAGHEEGKKVSA